MTIKLILDSTIAASNNKLTRNNIAVESKTRPNTLSDLASGSSKSIKFETLNDILDAMNRIDKGKNYDISDIIAYKKED